MIYELTDDHGSRYGQTDSLFHAKIMANEQARKSGVRIYVYHLATSFITLGRYGETCHYIAYPEGN